MNVLITGGCGFVGSNLAAEALRRGAQVTVLDNLSRVGSRQNLAWLHGLGSIDFRELDVRDAESVRQLIDSLQPDTIFHLAGQVAMTTSIQNPRRDFEINTMGTINVLEAVRLHAPDTLMVYSSTNKVYGDLEYLTYQETDSRWNLPDYAAGLPETIKLDFSSPYGCSKGAADQYMLDYHRVYGLNTVVLRHSSMYGGRQYATYDQGWVGWFCAKAIEAAGGHRDPFTISGDGKQVRDLLHADDLVALYYAISEQRSAAAGQVFNIGGGMSNSLSLLELMSKLQSQLGIQLHWQHIAARQSDQRVFVADIGKVHGYLNWRPRVTVDSGLERMLTWVSNNAA